MDLEEEWVCKGGGGAAGGGERMHGVCLNSQQFLKVMTTQMVVM